jgi:hypothetical protein
VQQSIGVCHARAQSFVSTVTARHAVCRMRGRWTTRTHFRRCLSARGRCICGREVLCSMRTVISGAHGTRSRTRGPSASTTRGRQPDFCSAAAPKKSPSPGGANWKGNRPNGSNGRGLIQRPRAGRLSIIRAPGPQDYRCELRRGSKPADWRRRRSLSTQGYFRWTALVSAVKVTLQSVRAVRGNDARRGFDEESRDSLYRGVCRTGLRI